MINPDNDEDDESKSKSKSRSKSKSEPSPKPKSTSSQSIFPNAPIAPGAPLRPLLNWSHFKPKFAGKPDEDAEEHLLRMNDCMDTHEFPDQGKVQRFCLTLIWGS